MAIASEIDGQPFTALVCQRCELRTRRIPASTRERLFAVAAGRIGRSPERYAVRVCADQIEARMLAGLAAEPATAGAAIDLIAGAE